jgi:hypothetical protein
MGEEVAELAQPGVTKMHNQKAKAGPEGHYGPRIEGDYSGTSVLRHKFTQKNKNPRG